MGGGTQTTRGTFDPAGQSARNQLLSIFQQPGTFGLTSGLQRQAVGGIQQFLGQPAPEQRAFDIGLESLMPLLQGQGQFGNVATALQPLFQRNLQEGISQLGAAAPGRFSSAFLQQGTNLAQRGMQDFNLFVEQARQADIQNRLQGIGQLGMLSQAAGQNPFARLLGAGQLGQQGQLGLMRLLLGLGQPTGQQQSGGGGFGSLLGGLFGFGAGSILGPLGGAAGTAIGRKLFPSAFPAEP